jgi:hypothetical protein
MAGFVSGAGLIITGGAVTVMPLNIKSHLIRAGRKP